MKIRYSFGMDGARN